jgi:SPP1 family predicted phage head-tail adaptor
MPRCQKIRRSKRQVCVGDLDTEVILQDRAIKGITTSNVNFDETFADAATVWAMIETVAGATVFDSTNTEVALTHRIYIRFDATVTAETWVEIDNDKYDIVTVEDLDRRSEFMRLNCVIRGPETSKVNLS